ncbi:hypothetical protein [Neobacillus niacini]|uniref:hypothetical protein n=1 Tax=Neobacillus niacini TaxID=86668 RepID=UPI0005EFA7F7|nr:hypothetical protein [Neobacillus niacini]
MGMKLIYKKSMALSLIRMGNDLEYTARNRENPKYQVYFFEHTEKLNNDIAILQEQLEKEREMNGTFKGRESRISN